MRGKCFLIVPALLLLAALAPAQVPRNPLPVPDVLGYKSLKCDFHTHTVFSDGEVWPTTRVIEAWREGLDVIAITDHDDVSPHRDDVNTDLRRPHQIALPVAQQLGIVLVPGVEITKGEFHFNALFVKEFNAFTGLDRMSALREARRQGTFVFWNHPGWRRPTAWFPEVAELHEENLIHGFELVNGSTVYTDGFSWMDEKGLAVISNSDIHAPSLPKQPGPSRALTLVFARSADLEGVREGLFARRTLAWMGGELWGSEKYLAGLWDAAVKSETTELAPPAGTRTAVLVLANHSAIPFQVRIRNAPSWLGVRGGEIPPQASNALRVSFAKDAPAGPQNVELELEITNLHPGPDRNLIVRFPLRVNLAK